MTDAKQPGGPIADASARYRRALRMVVAFNACIAVLSFSVPLFTMQVYDRVLASGSHETLLALLAITVLLVVGQGVLEALRGAYLARSAAVFDRDLAPSLLARSLRLATMRPGDNASQSLTDARRLRDALGGSATVAVSELPFAALFLAVCFVFHPLLGWTTLAGMAVVAAVALALHRANAGAVSEEHRGNSEIDGLGRRLVGDAPTIGAAGALGGLRRRFLASRGALTVRAAGTTERLAASQVTTRTVRLAVQVLLTAVGALLVIRGALSPGMLIATGIIAGKALAPIDQLVAQWRAIVAARESYTRLARLFAAVPDERPGARIDRLEGRIALEGVGLNAPGSRRAVLSGVTLSAPAGATLALTGPNGGGKSLLLAAIANGRPVSSGTIRLDGVPIDHHDPDSLARHIGYLPQRVDLLPGTIAQNVARFGEEDDAALAEAVTLAGAREIVADLPDGLQSVYPNEVPDLSAGLLRRLGLARALYGRPAVLLLDEPLTDLDTAGRNMVVDLVRRLKAMPCTLVMVTAAPPLLALCDGGLTIERGAARVAHSPAELLGAGPAQPTARRA